MFCSLSVYGQDPEPDSTTTTEVIYLTPEKQEKEKESLGDVFVRLGKGFLERLKYRFNLEAVENKVERTQKKLKNEDKKSSGS